MELQNGTCYVTVIIPISRCLDATEALSIRTVTSMRKAKNIKYCLAQLTFNDGIYEQSYLKFVG